MKGAASIAHLTGKPFVASEALTTIFNPWAFAPAELKPSVDLAFAMGINRIVLHSAVHQPRDDVRPGLPLGYFGQNFSRHESWAEAAKPWIDYIARGSFLLQQGRPHADIAYFYGEDGALTALYGTAALGHLPTRFAYDFINADMLALIRVEQGRLVMPSGARYRALQLGPASRRMTLAVLERVAALVHDGATVVGGRPFAFPSLGDDPARFERLAGQLWAGGPATSYGAGRVVASPDAEEALIAAGAIPDFDVSGAQSPADMPFVHRVLADGELASAVVV